MKEASNVIRILKATRKAVREKDVVSLKKLSNQTIHAASIEQDGDNVAVAVIVYALGKILERKGSGEDGKCGELCTRISKLLNQVVISLQKGDEIGTRKSLDLIRKDIQKGSKEFKEYVQDVFRKASINKASRIYGHGVSMERTASLLGITMFELASYSGQKQAVKDEKEQKTISARDRVKIAMEIFK